MDVAVAIFNIGAGLGLLALGAGVIALAVGVMPLVREWRALAADARGLAAALETDGRPILASLRELTGNVEVLSEDVAVKLDRLTDLMNALQASLERGQPAVAPVESWNADEERQDG